MKNEPVPLRHDGDIEDAEAKLFQNNCPNCKSTRTARDILWGLYLVMALAWLIPPASNLLSHSDRAAWFFVGLAVCVFAIVLDPNRYCKACGTRFRGIYRA